MPCGILHGLFILKHEPKRKRMTFVILFLFVFGDRNRWHAKNVEFIRVLRLFWSFLSLILKVFCATALLRQFLLATEIDDIAFSLFLCLQRWNFWLLNDVEHPHRWWTREASSSPALLNQILNCRNIKDMFFGYLIESRVASDRWLLAFQFVVVVPICESFC